MMFFISDYVSKQKTIRTDARTRLSALWCE